MSSQHVAAKRTYEAKPPAVKGTSETKQPLLPLSEPINVHLDILLKIWKEI